jgi:hypothetical protein
LQVLWVNMFAVFVLYRTDVVLWRRPNVGVEVRLDRERVTLNLFDLIIQLFTDLFLSVLECLFGGPAKLNE